MLASTQRITSALAHEFRKLLPRLSDSGTDGSAAQAIMHGLTLLQERDRNGEAWSRETLADRRATLDRLKATLPEDAEVRHLIEAAAQAGASGPVADEWHKLASANETLAMALNRLPLTPAQRVDLCAAMVDWEAGALSRDLGTDGGSATAPDTEISKERLEAYLRTRFDDPALAVDVFQPLAGGFGKETIIFSAEGKALSGQFVMRRDLGKSVSLTNDCHEISREYPVVRALHKKGFPAPDALWLDTEHSDLPGGDFVVMRRSPGTLGGSFFGAQAAIPPSIGGALADIAARLHALPPLEELGDVASFIRPDLWTLSRGEAARRYIEGWYDYYLSEAHCPSPALASIYGWLLDNVPDRPGRPSMIHGDIGFHNFLFQDGALSAVLDWEFAHIGDPAEELGYIRLTVGAGLDWPDFMARYVAAGGDPVDERTLHFFQVWGFARNASAANIVISRFNRGVVDDLKLSVLPHHHYTKFLRGAHALIASAP
jgi:aminoglycoside phosphotransferase (APT) family kinase protein